MDFESVLLHCIAFCILIVLTQDIQIFPGAVTSIFNRRTRDPRTLPPEVESIFVETKDRKSLEVWRLPPHPDSTPKPQIAIVFHGNGGPLETFILLQMWFAELGITSYSFDYRGYGKSSGWPSERGIALDSDAVWNYVTARENAAPEKMILFGLSIGAAPAARLATIHQPLLLVLVSGFTNLRRVVKEQALMRIFSPFVRYDFPTLRYVQQLTRTNLLVAHGEQDEMIRFQHSLELRDAYRGSGSVRLIAVPEGTHNSTFLEVRPELAEAVVGQIALATIS